MNKIQTLLLLPFFLISLSFFPFSSPRLSIPSIYPNSPSPSLFSPSMSNSDFPSALFLPSPFFLPTRHPYIITSILYLSSHLSTEKALTKYGIPQGQKQIHSFDYHKNNNNHNAHSHSHSPSPSPSSVHYVLSPNGTLYQLVSDSSVPYSVSHVTSDSEYFWTSDKVSPNFWTLSVDIIDVDNEGNPMGNYTKMQISTLSALVKYILSKYNPNLQMVRYDDFDTTLPSPSPLISFPMETFQRLTSLPNSTAPPNYPKAKLSLSPNFDVGRFTSNHILGIVLHGTAMAGGAQQWFLQSASGVSAHYVVHQDGSVTQMVSEENSAWHNGVVTSGSQWFGLGEGDPNHWTIGIEHERSRENNNPMSSQQVNGSLALVENIIQRYLLQYGKVIEVWVHSQFHVGRTCPGPGFPLNKYLNMRGKMIQKTEREIEWERENRRGRGEL